MRNNYLPFTAVSSILAAFSDTVQASAMVAEIVSPGSLQQANPQTATAKSLATLFRAYGSPCALLLSLQQAQATIEEIRGSYAEIHQKFQKQLETSKSECNDFFTTFTQKIALAEPRNYWNNRAIQHTKSSTIANRVWNVALVVVVLIVLTLIYLSLNGTIDLSVPRKGETTDFAVLLERLTLVGTILGFVVWWLRQKLRDVRSHEHLAEDAAERVTMIDTYSALRRAGLQDADLTPILTALYRPATTGLIDDGGPILPMEILLKSAANVVK